MIVYAGYFNVSLRYLSGYIGHETQEVILNSANGKLEFLGQKPLV